MPLWVSSIGDLKNSFITTFILATVALWPQDISAVGSPEDSGVRARVQLSGLPVFELNQALRDGFRSEVTVYLRLMRKAQGRFPWIDETRVEMVSTRTVWYDKLSRHYIIEDEVGRVSGFNTINQVFDYLSTVQFFLKSPEVRNQPSQWYLLFRAEIKPIRLSEPFQIFLFYPFFRNFATHWRTSELETQSEWSP